MLGRTYSRGDTLTTVEPILPFSLPTSVVSSGSEVDDYEFTLPGANGSSQVTVTEIGSNECVIDMPPPPQRVVYLQDCVDKEKDYWKNKYENDLEFHVKINNFVNFRAEVFKLKDKGVSAAELDALFSKLGSMLADAFGMIDPATGDWTQEVKEAFAEAGDEYAEASVRALCIGNLPTGLRSAFNLLGQAAVGLGAPPAVSTVVSNLTGFLAAGFQVPVSIYAAQENARLQSEGVQLQKWANPKYVPNVLSTAKVKEDGSPDELRPLMHVQEDLNELDHVTKLIDSGTEAELEGASLYYSGKIDGARARLMKLLSGVTDTLGRLQQHKARLNAIEKELVNPNIPQSKRIDLMSKITRGRVALSGPKRQEAKRLLDQIKHWDVLVEELDAAHQTLKKQRCTEATEASSPTANTGEASRPTKQSERLRKAHQDSAFEQIVSLRYRALNVLSNQSLSRDIRTLFNLGIPLEQLVYQVTTSITGEQADPTNDAWTLGLALAQTILYAWLHPKASAEDYANKVATQWVIASMIGSTNFVDETGKVVPSKLDKAVNGPLWTRLNTLAAILVFDRSGYTQNILGWIIDVSTLDDDEAVKVNLTLPKKDASGKLVKDKNSQVVTETRSVPCTYLCLATEFQALPDREHRETFVAELAQQRAASADVRQSMLNNLALYEANEANLASAKNGNVASLLKNLGESSGDHSSKIALEELLEWFVPKEGEESVDVALTLPMEKGEESDDETSSEEESEEKRSLPCTVESLATEFQKLSTHRERKRFMDELAQQRHPSKEDKEQIKKDLAFFERTQEAGLPPDIAKILEASLLAASGRADADLTKLDRRLFELMGKVEQRKEDATLQTAQKLGQQYAWLLAGTGGFQFLRSIFTFAAQALIAAGDYGGAQVAESLANWLLGVKDTGIIFQAASTLFSFGLNHAYHEYILRKNEQRLISGKNISVVNVPEPSLRRALTQEFLAFLGDPHARVEEVTDYSTLAGTQVPEADRPPKMKFIRQTKLTEATWEQMFAADLSSEPVSTWLGYFWEEHGSLEGKTKNDLAEAMRQDLQRIMDYLNPPSRTEDANASASARADADANVVATPKELPDGDPRTRIQHDEVVRISEAMSTVSEDVLDKVERTRSFSTVESKGSPSPVERNRSTPGSVERKRSPNSTGRDKPLIPPLRTIPESVSESRRTPRVNFDWLPLTPRTTRLVNMEDLPELPTTPREKAPDFVSLGRKNPLTKRVTGKIEKIRDISKALHHATETAIDPPTRYVDPGDIQRFDLVNEVNEEAASSTNLDAYPPVVNEPTLVGPQRRAPSVMQSLKWDRSDQRDGFFITSTSTYHYLSRDPFGADAIRAYGVPTDEQSIMHIADDRNPTLAVANMLQMRISENKAWGALASSTDFAVFFNEELSRHVRPEDQPFHIAHKPFGDLTLFSQQMAVNHPDKSWSPLTGAGGAYLPNDTEQQFQYIGIPPILTDGAPFGLQYSGYGWDDQPITNSVMLARDETGTYVAVDPKSKIHVRLDVPDAQGALKAFMTLAAQDCQIEGFNVLYHVQPGFDAELAARIRAVILAGGDASGIVDSLYSEDRSAAGVREWLEGARNALEAEKAHILKQVHEHDDVRQAAAMQVFEINDHFRVLEEAYRVLLHSNA